MNPIKNKVVKNQRIFNVGLVDASKNEINAISRIFAVTNFRKRCYRPINANEKQSTNIDFYIVCSRKLAIISKWIQLSKQGQPPIFLTHKLQKRIGAYQLSSPINPGKFIQLLDRYTIKELNYFPEFEIGTENSTFDNATISGLKALRSSRLKNPTDEEVRNVLVVDDSLAVRRQMLLEFQLRSDHLDVVSTAEEAMNAIEEKRYDIIFMDVVMPGMDGYSACKKIKKDRNNSDTPVILLTSKSSSFDKIKGALAGCDAYLVKPINHNEFEEVYNRFTQTDIRGEAAHAS